ncbi:MAG TPA: PQQ-dependent dehydrogenase, methanol/ethanol family [Gemmatimonadales bacterium]|nr:PQQ-dependent dehydrogenase, methanol/ethanol family [Gemmatimonadales bacterium]
MRLRYWVGAIALVGIVLLATALTLESVRWRVKVMLLKLKGDLPELGWIELGRMLNPSGPYHIEDVATRGSGFAGVHNPYRGPDDVAAGLTDFEARCATCHGAMGAGASAPDLRSAVLERGNSDWALYQVIQRGIPGTGMPAHPLEDRELWRLVAAVTELRTRFSSAESPAVLAEPPDVSAERLLGAEGDSANWLMYHGSYGGWRHSRLRQLDTSNVSRLRVAWIYQTEHDFGRVETTPVVVDNVMYFTEPGAAVVALDAATGSVRWKFTPRLGDLRLCCGVVNRGVAVLGTTVYVGTPDARLIALDGRTGKPRWEARVAESRSGYSFTSAPLALGGMIIAGVAGGEFGIRGFVDAYDAQTGQRRWRFYTIPEPGKPGSETWGEGGALATGGGPAWLTGSYDRELGLVYLGVGNPSPDYDGSSRPGDNLYTNSVVAIQAETGELAWHFQFTPHDTHDYDAVQVPALIDAKIGGIDRKLLLFANKNGFYYVLDRITGRFVTARAYATQTWASGLDSVGRPIVRPDATPSETGALVYPSQNGATNWWSPSYSPRTGMFYVPVHEQGSVFFRRGEDYSAGSDYLGGHGQIRTTDAAGFVRALDALTGELRWEHRFTGDLPSNLLGGILTTAGGLVFTGAGDVFGAFHDRSGRELWRFNVGGRVSSAPITYLQNGRQRVTVAAGRAILTFE